VVLVAAVIAEVVGAVVALLAVVEAVGAVDAGLPDTAVVLGVALEGVHTGGAALGGLHRLVAARVGLSAFLAVVGLRGELGGLGEVLVCEGVDLAGHRGAPIGRVVVGV